MAEDWSQYQVKSDNKTDWSKYQTKDQSNDESPLASLWHKATKFITEPILPERDFGSDINSIFRKPLQIDIPMFGGKVPLGIPSMNELYENIKDFSSPLNIAASLYPLAEKGVALIGKRQRAAGTSKIATPSMQSSDINKTEVPVDVARDFAPVGEEGNLIRNKGNEFKDTEEAIYENAKNRFNMGKSTDRPNLSVDEVNKLFSNPAPLKEGTTINFGSNRLPKRDAPIVSSLKPATPELIEQAQAKGPDVIHLKTADKTQLENAGLYGYKFEGVNSDGSLRLRKQPIADEQNIRVNPQTGEEFAGDSPYKPEFTNDGGPPDNGDGHIGDIVDRRKATVAQEVLNLPRGIMSAWDLSAPFRQGLGMITRPEWWKSWNTMFKSYGSEEAFRQLQQSIADKPLFKSFEGQPSFAEKAGLKLSDLTDLNSREEQIMSTWAEKVPGVRASNRAYTAFLNKLRADAFENMISEAKVLNNATGEFDMNLSKEIAGFINNATGRGSLGSLEKYAPALNSIFFSPRLIASRLQTLNPVYYMTASPYVRRQAIRSLIGIAGMGQLVTQLGKMASGEVESDPTSSDFGKLKIGNTRIDPYGGYQQYIVAANRLLQGRTKSSVTGKETELNTGKFGQPTQMDVLQRFGESKLNPVINLATTILRGKNQAGMSVDLPEEVASKFVPLFIQDLKNVATENPNLIPYYHEEGLGFEDTNIGRGSLALPGAVGMGIQNYQLR